MKCNKCKSSNVQRYQVIHEQGTSNIDLSSNTVGGGVGFGGGLRGGVGLGRTGTSGKSQTLIAEKTQPPKDIRVSQIISFLVVGAIFFAFFYYKIEPFLIYFFISYVIIGFVLAIFLIKKGGEEYEKNYNEWLNKWYCNKCGNTFLNKQTI